jgi:ferrous iron transport protein B
LKKIGTVVLIAMMTIWFLSHFPQNTVIETDNSTEHPKYTLSYQDDTYLSRFGHFIEPALRPLGFDWRMSVCLTTGLAAKEFIVGTMAILYQTGEEDPHIDDHLKSTGVFTPPVALSFLVFAMLYMPCIATIFSIKRVSNTWKWALFSVGYSIVLAWGIAFVVFKVADILF